MKARLRSYSFLNGPSGAGVLIERSTTGIWFMNNGSNADSERINADLEKIEDKSIYKNVSVW